MEQYEFFYGTQLMEYERSDVPDVILEKGIKMNIGDSKYSLNIKPSNTKVVVKCSQ